MADEQDERSELLMNRLVVLYAKIATALEALPLPIELPAGAVNVFGDCLPAVGRAYDIFDEQPLPEEQAAMATTALLYWLTACEMVLSYSLSGANYRSDAAALCLINGAIAVDELLEALGLGGS